MYSEAGSNKCPASSVRIETEAACRRAAAAMGMLFIGANNFSAAPSGCYAKPTTTDRRVYLNTNSQGAGSTTRQLVCTVSATATPTATPFVKTLAPSTTALATCAPASQTPSCPIRARASARSDCAPCDVKWAVRTVACSPALFCCLPVLRLFCGRQTRVPTAVPPCVMRDYTWGSSQTAGGLPLKKGIKFSIAIQQSSTGFEVTIDGVRLPEFDFKQRIAGEVTGVRLQSPNLQDFRLYSSATPKLSPAPTFVPTLAPTPTPTVPPTRAPTRAPTRSPTGKVAGLFGAIGSGIKGAWHDVVGSKTPTKALFTRVPTFVPTVTPTSVPTVLPPTVPTIRRARAAETTAPLDGPLSRPALPPDRLDPIIETRDEPDPYTADVTGATQRCTYARDNWLKALPCGKACKDGQQCRAGNGLTLVCELVNWASNCGCTCR